MWLLLAFIAVPLIEIALFIQVGGVIGLWPTLAIVLLTALLGSWLVRREGLRALADLQQSFNTLQDPTEPLAAGAMILFAGALLLTPGFFTDAVGFLLLIPQTRALIIRGIRERVKAQSFTVHTQHQTFHSTGTPDRGTIDGEFTVVDPDETGSENQRH